MYAEVAILRQQLQTELEYHYKDLTASFETVCQPVSQEQEDTQVIAVPVMYTRVASDAPGVSIHMSHVIRTCTHARMHLRVSLCLNGWHACGVRVCVMCLCATCVSRAMYCDSM